MKAAEMRDKWESGTIARMTFGFVQAAQAISCVASQAMISVMLLFVITGTGASAQSSADQTAAYSSTSLELQSTPSATAPPVADIETGAYTYRLGMGDKVQVTVYGEDDLSGAFEVDGSGNVRLPLIGQVKAAGFTLKEFETAVELRLQHGFLVNPRVNATVTNYRPFQILGEVNKPGEYPYENGMTALNAIAIGGGFTYRANEDQVYVRRKGATAEVEMPANGTTLVYPGDTVTVKERTF
jgi:polysaccharide export outer membrane protein